MISFIAHINFLPVFVASIASFAIGAIWFGPKTFYPVWMRALGREIPTERVQMKAGETALMFGGTYLAALIQAATLALVIAVIRSSVENFGWADGALAGLILSVGIGAFASISHRMFGQADFKVYRSLKVWVIEVGQDLVCLTLAGVIIGAWS